MTKSITRRSVLANSAAAVSAMGIGMVSTVANAGYSGISAPSKKPSSCTESHLDIMNNLHADYKSAEKQGLSISKAIKTSSCPQCGTRIGFDPAAT